MIKVSANIALLAVVWMLPLVAQTENISADASSLQWKKIADSVLIGIPMPPSGRIALVVEAEKDRSLIENAFLATSEKKGLQILLEQEAASQGTPLMRISGIVNVGPASNNVSCDVRWEEVGGVARYLGRFRGGAEDPAADSGSGTVFERFVEPLVVIAGAVLIVYLFFTVRS